jgi:hypothetical protein
MPVGVFAMIASTRRNDPTPCPVLPIGPPALDQSVRKIINLNEVIPVLERRHLETYTSGDHNTRGA